MKVTPTMTNRPPERIFHYGPPENAQAIEPLIRPICQRINESGWLWTVESCEGHEPDKRPEFGWGFPDPMIRFGLRTAHVGHLLLLLKRATCDTAYAEVIPGFCPDETWSDALTYIRGVTPLDERRKCYEKLAEMAVANPPAGRALFDKLGVEA
jgi:hypothetical protein